MVERRGTLVLRQRVRIGERGRAPERGLEGVEVAAEEGALELVAPAGGDHRLQRIVAGRGAHDAAQAAHGVRDHVPEARVPGVIRPHRLRDGLARHGRSALGGEEREQLARLLERPAGDRGGSEPQLEGPEAAHREDRLRARRHATRRRGEVIVSEQRGLTDRSRRPTQTGRPPRFRLGQRHRGFVGRGFAGWGRLVPLRHDLLFGLRQGDGHPLRPAPSLALCARRPGRRVRKDPARARCPTRRMPGSRRSPRGRRPPRTRRAGRGA